MATGSSPIEKITGNTTTTAAAAAGMLRLARFIVLLILATIATTDGSADVFQVHLEPPTRPPQHQQHLQNSTSAPHFGVTNTHHVYTRLGAPAYLHCNIQQLGDYAVSWVRRRDLQILTVGRFTYTSDHRFSSVHAHQSDEWPLKISSAGSEDSGLYDCQVSTEPKISQTFRLTVVDSRAVIQGPREVHLKSGTNVNLTCVIKTDDGIVQEIDWYFNNMVMQYAYRGGILIETDQIRRVSHLVVAMATAHDSGNYSCRPSHSLADSVMVHILNGELPAAMQHGHSTLHCGVTLLQWAVQLMVLFLLRY